MNEILTTTKQVCPEYFDDTNSVTESLDKLCLTDVIDIEVLQNLQDTFARAVDIGTVIVDLDGNFITRPSNFSEVCQLIQQSEKGKKRCSISDFARNKKIHQQIKPSYQQCLSCGFADGSAPLYIGDIHIANWLIGQCKVVGVDRESIRKYAEEIEVDVERMLDAFDKMPVMTVEKFERILDLHYAIARELSRLGFNNLRLKREIKAKELMSSKLNSSEKLLQECFNSVMEGICLVDKDGNMIFANQASIDMIGADSLERIVGVNVISFFSDDQVNIIKKQKQIRQKGRSSKYEIKLKNLHSQELSLLISAAPRYDTVGNFDGAFATIVDITEQKRLQDYYSRAQRLETAGRIAAQVAHDFNNLLGPLVAYPELIGKYLPKDSPAQNLLSEIDKTASIMAEINQQLLALGRRGHYNFENLDINNILLQSLENIKSKLAKVDIKLDLSDQVLAVKGGGSQLIRVVTNLLNNALDAMNKTARLHIKSENYYVDHINSEWYQVPMGEYVKITIADTGSGISPEHMSVIFDPFFTTKKSDTKRGSGLGLSVVYSVMQDHNGYISINSKPGRGTSVYLYFPPERDGVSEKEDASIIRGNEKILVVDDDAVQRSVAENLLGDLGYYVKTCKSGEEAVSHLKNNDYDLIILDMIMPLGMDGAKTYEEILKFKPAQKALIVSGYADSKRVKKAHQLGINGFISKPLKAKSISKTLRDVLESPKQSL